MAAVTLAASPAAAVERQQYLHATPPVAAHPLPQGTPYITNGHPSHVPTELRYALLDGKRYLFDAATGNIVYRLNP